MLADTTTTLTVTRTFDELNRVNIIEASYFDVSSHQIADYDYTGPFRIRKKTLGETGSHNRKNASYMLPGYDGLRRVTAFDWKDLNNEKLVGSDYAYDDVGNPLNEKFDHDEDRYDNFTYGRDAEMASVQPSKQARRCEAASTSSPSFVTATVARKTLARCRRPGPQGPGTGTGYVCAAWWRRPLAGLVSLRSLD